jgi:hypothetical protein
MLPHAAGVEEQDVCVIWFGGEAISKRLKMASNKLAIEFVHLTSKGLEVDGLQGVDLSDK